MQFRPKSEYPPARAPAEVASPDTPRGRLAEAIRDRDTAIKAVDDARKAEEKARLATYSAEHGVDLLRAQADEAATGDVVSAIVGGVDDVLALDKPAAEVRRQIEAAEQKAWAWRDAANQAEEAIPIREAALERAEGKVAACAKAVLAGSINVDELLAEAKGAADWLVGQRALFLYLMTILPPGREHDALAAFMSRPWLEAEFSGGWRKNAAIAPYADALAKLRSDAEAAVDIAP